MLALQRNATAMNDATPLPFDLPAVARKKLTVDFDGGNQSSDGGMLALRAAEQRIGIIAQLTSNQLQRNLPHGLTQSQFSVLNWFLRVDDEASPDACRLENRLRQLLFRSPPPWLRQGLARESEERSENGGEP